MKHRIVVSPEMIAFVGKGEVAGAEWPDEPVLLRFFDIERGSPAVATAPMADIGGTTNDALLLVVAAAACRRLFGQVPEDGNWHLPGDLREMVLGIRDCAVPEPARDTLRLAKSIELFCTLMERLRCDALVPIAGSGALSELDTLRIARARRLIDEHWHEKLTLESIARACGLNRGKLARGFRSTYACTVADALTDQRLSHARGMLRSTDLPVKAIGYRCGYLNHASFTRAFSRHFGVAPTQMRAGVVAA